MWGWKVLLRRALYGAILGWCYHVQECKFSCSDHIVSLSFPIVGKWVHIYQIHKILSSTKVFSSVQWLSRVWLLWPHGLQPAKPPCPSPTPRVYSNSCPLCRWCHPTISSSVVPFSSCPQSLPTSGSFPMSQFFTSGGQSWNFSFNISPSNEHSGLISFRMDWLDLLAVQVTPKSFLQHHSSKVIILWCSAFFTFQLSHPYITTGKTIALTRWNFAKK